MRIADEPLLIIFSIVAAVLSIPLAFVSESAAFRLGLIPTPGMYVYHLLHSPTDPPSSLGSMFATMMMIDGACWFVVLAALGFALDREIKNRQIEREEQERLDG